MKSGFTVLPKNSDPKIYQIMAVQQDIYNLKYTEVLNKESLSRKGYYQRFHIFEAVLTGFVKIMTNLFLPSPSPQNNKEVLQSTPHTYIQTCWEAYNAVQVPKELRAGRI